MPYFIYKGSLPSKSILPWLSGIPFVDDSCFEEAILDIDININDLLNCNIDFSESIEKISTSSSPQVNSFETDKIDLHDSYV